MQTQREQEPQPARSVERLLVWANVALAVVAVLSLVLNLVFVTLQTQLAVTQNEIMRIANQPVFVISRNDVASSERGTCSQLTVTNEGAPVESFEVEVYTFVRVLAYPDEPSTGEATLAPEGYDDWYRRTGSMTTLALNGYYEYSGSGSGSGVLYQSAGLPFGMTNQQVVDGAVEAIQVELGLPAHHLFGPVDAYLFIDYVDKSGESHEVEYLVPDSGAARRLTPEETEQLIRAMADSSSAEDSLSCYNPPAPETIVAAYRTAVASGTYSDLPWP